MTSSIDATNTLMMYLSGLARTRLEEINRQTGAGLPQILEALVMRGIDDLSPKTMRKLFPDRLQSEPVVMARTKNAAGDAVECLSNGGYRVVLHVSDDEMAEANALSDVEDPAVFLLGEKRVSDTEVVRAYSDGSRRWLSA